MSREGDRTNALPMRKSFVMAQSSIACCAISFLRRIHSMDSLVFQFLYGTLAVSSLLGPGMSMGYSAIALPLLKNSAEQPILRENEATWFASIAMISTPVGCIVSLFTMKAGRRAAISCSGIVCSVGWIIIATSYTVTQLLFGRFVTGFATGLASTPACVYLAEISIPRYTAMLTTCSSLFISIGIMLIYFLGFIIKDDWRMVAVASVIVPTLSAVLALAVMPESPRWLLTKGREEEARKSLLRLRSLEHETANFRDEFDALLRYNEPKYEIEMSSPDSTRLPTIECEKSGNKVSTKSYRLKNELRNDLGVSGRVKKFVKTLGLPEIWKPLVILNAFFFFQQFCGIYVLMAYAVDLLEKTGSANDPYLITAVIGLVQIGGAFCLVLTSFRLGRRPVTLISGSGMTISLAGLGIYNQLFENTLFSQIPLTCIFVFVASGSFGFLALPWAMIGELFPTRYVNVLGPTTTCLAGLYNFATVQIYPSLAEFGPIVMIYTYCAISLLATLFVALVLPETLGKTKEEIERGFRNRSQ
ncbi:facilitated trehalose transporter Tret1-like isoform X2 [Venturia canescens]|uniref:facilitated trehalose transporter Tret1-like isoform X2 n=1 Tax=Venturia canescens TaxID=32260 RepID=UPI001C9BBFAA|nr:facilitated trehalose transporter Tret1-like isoform X2 [Venturia canescens]